MREKEGDTIMDGCEMIKMASTEENKMTQWEDKTGIRVYR